MVTQKIIKQLGANGKPVDVQEVTFHTPSGIADSMYLGAADLRNVDVASIPGIIQLSLAATKKSGTVFGTTEIPYWAVIDNDANRTCYVLTSLGKVYKASNAASNA